MLERSNKLLHAFLMFAKPLILFELTGCYTSFSRSSAGYQDLYTDVKAQVLCEGVLSRKFSVSQEQDKAEFLLPSCIKFTFI